MSANNCYDNADRLIATTSSGATTVGIQSKLVLTHTWAATGPTIREAKMRRLVIAIASVIVVVAVLSGCSPDFDSAIKRAPDGSLTFEYCRQLEGNRVEAVGITKDNDYVVLWNATSASVIAVPTTIQLGQALGDFKSSGDMTDLSGYTSLNVSVQTKKDGILAESQDALFKVASISQGHWLRSDGSTAETPCASK